MTILPNKNNSKKKASTSTKNGGDDKVTDGHGDRHGAERDRYGHGHASFHTTHGHGHASPTRWSVSARVGEEKRSVSEVECGVNDGGPSHSKRRHRERGENHARPIGRKNKNVNASASASVAVEVLDENINVNNVQVTASCSNGDSNVGELETSSHSTHSGYNSSDEYDRPADMWTPEELEEREKHFEKKMRKKGWTIKFMNEDGACLFRAVADQIYGDQDMHNSVRKLCMDYMAKNSDYFSQYVTEDFEKYIQRKRCDHIHGNHIEMQAMSELFNRPIEVYHYSIEPINIFQGCHQTETDSFPIRLSYHRNVHYNSIVDPYKASIGVGLGLPALKPGLAEKNLMENAIHISEQTEIEQAMLEDKLKATDWEATNEAIEEQVARESYIEWVRENETRSNAMKSKQAKQASPSSSASSTSTNTTFSELCSSKSPNSLSNSKGSSPKSTVSQPSPRSSPRSSPKASSSGTNTRTKTSEKETTSYSHPNSEFSLVETDSFMHQLPPSVFGLSDWGDDNMLAKVIAQSQQEYLDALKKQKIESNVDSSDIPNTSNSDSHSRESTSTSKS